MGRPPRGCSTFRNSHFIRVPSPAARMIACTVRISWASCGYASRSTRIMFNMNTGEPGFEPGRRAPKALVLPLHYSPIQHGLCSSLGALSLIHVQHLALQVLPKLRRDRMSDVAVRRRLGALGLRDCRRRLPPAAAPAAIGAAAERF